MKILGFDPGIRGGLAIVEINDGAVPQLVDAIDIPTAGTGAKERVDAVALTSWITAHRPQQALIKPYGEPVRELLTFLRTMSLDEGPQLIELVRASDWHRTDPDTGFEILSLINAAITELRERHNLPPFDDGIPPDDEPTAFIVIREMFK